MPSGGVGDEDVVVGLVFEEVEDEAVGEVLDDEVGGVGFGSFLVADAVADAFVIVPDVAKGSFAFGGVEVAFGGDFGVVVVVAAVVEEDVDPVAVFAPDHEAALIDLVGGGAAVGLVDGAAELVVVGGVEGAAPTVADRLLACDGGNNRVASCGQGRRRDDGDDEGGIRYRCRSGFGGRGGCFCGRNGRICGQQRRSWSRGRGVGIGE